MKKNNNTYKNGELAIIHTEWCLCQPDMEYTWHASHSQFEVCILTNLHCLRNVSNLLDMEYFSLKTASKCMGMMHHRLAQNEGFGDFLVG